MKLKLHLQFTSVVEAEFYGMLVIKTFYRIQLVPYPFVRERANYLATVPCY